MIASATELMKFKRLQRRLNLRRYETIGLLEALWRATIINAKQGDIGRLSNEEIATEIDWPGDPDELIKALVETSWLDTDYSHRLLVHDWKDHCPKYIKGVLARLNLKIHEPRVGDFKSVTNSQGLNPIELPTQSSAQRKSIAVKSIAVDNESPTQIQNSEPALEETAVDVYLDVMKNNRGYLNPVTWSMIEENIIQSPKSLAFWRKVVTAWAAEGWNPRGVKGMIEYYQRREIPKGKAAPVQSEPEGVKDEMTPEELARISARRKELKAILAANKAKAAEEAAKAEAEKAKGE